MRPTTREVQLIKAENDFAEQERTWSGESSKELKRLHTGPLLKVLSLRNK